ncbi:putative lipid II flippase FtsW [Streptomyces sp. OF3]|uniref:Probable peptidoglycan glycosyltransferase FtsW n=1 Tax=Streptomyces alkaliterrae TaxID=2213162 RepID=A0A7W3WJF4_9ACTN|nr:putative lipid II flippase FtsW [Streptomyces alkaliterrae]MBB1253424.1 putative lipid II flippase FtsW [Streptomyces alkaliterrae]
MTADKRRGGGSAGAGVRSSASGRAGQAPRPAGGSRATAQSTAKAGARSTGAAGPAAKPTAKSAAKPTAKSPAKPTAKPRAKSTAKPRVSTAKPAANTAGATPPAVLARPLDGIRRLRNRARRAWDRPLTAYYLVLGGSLLITLLGLVMVFSSSQIEALRDNLPATYYFRKQLLAAAIGTVLLLIASRMPVKLLRALAYPVLAVSIVLLGLVQVPGIGVKVNGSTNWIQLGGSFQLQPSEFAKLALVLWGADLLARKGDRQLLRHWKHLLVPLVPGALLVCALVLLGGDMGTVMILVAILFGLLWIAGAPTRMFITVLSVSAVVGAALIMSAPHRMQRVACLGATEPGPGDACWQALHGIYALASGGWFGSGLGASVEKWGELPEPHTDFIFAITGEELGLAGTLSVLTLFAALGYAGIRVAGRTEDPFVRYAAGGVTCWLMAQVVINLGAVLGLLPIAGVPLPLFSYGGSALLPTMFAVGLLIAFARSDPAARAALAMRQPGVQKTLAGVRGKSMRRRVKRPPSGER